MANMPWDFEHLEKITQADIDKNFWKLPLALRKKIKPEPVISVELKALRAANYAKMNASITPPFCSLYQERPADNERAHTHGGAPLSGAGLPPLTNRGVLHSQKFEAPSLSSIEARERLQVVAIGTKGKYEFIRIPKPNKKVSKKFAFVDWVNFTWKISRLPLALSSGHYALTDRDYVQALSGYLFRIFGFGVCRQRESGMNFYKYSFDMGDPMQSTAWGMVCIGGQQESISVTIKGQGLMASKPGWEKRLYDFLVSIPDAKITRIDLANDNFHSATSVDDYLKMYYAGLFSNRGQNPSVEQAGNWVKPNGKGRTLYIGTRGSGKLLRIYEKGLQIASGFNDKINHSISFSHWVRVELELKNDQRIIPFEALLKPGQYLAGAYPALNGFHIEHERIDTFKKTAELTIETSLQITKHQFGKHIWSLAQYHGLEKAFELLTSGKEELPKRLDLISAYHADIDESEFFHKQPLLMAQSIGDVTIIRGNPSTT